MMKHLLLSFLFWLGCGTAVLAQDGNLKFKNMFKGFQLAVKSNTVSEISRFMRFPLPTAVESQDPDSGVPIDYMSDKEIRTHFSALFSKEHRKLVLSSRFSDVNEVAHSDGKYYLTLQKLTDKGSKLYELYVQYPESGTQAESYFSFVFGQVSRKYKVIGYYAKWPLK